MATERTTFLSFGLFYLCQMTMNGSFSPSQAGELLEFIVAKSANIEPMQPPKIADAKEDARTEANQDAMANASPLAGSATARPGSDVRQQIDVVDEMERQVRDMKNQMSGDTARKP